MMLQPSTHRQSPHLWLAAAFVLLAVTLGAAAILLLARPASAAPAGVADSTWVTDGRVSSVVRAGDRVYLGGSFTLVGPNTGFGAALSAADGRIDASFPRINDKVRAVVADGSGGWYIGGDFQRVGSAFRPGLAHILAGGAVDPAWKPRTDGSVNALALSPDGARLYAGGAFGAIDGATRNGLVALDAITGEADPGWNPDANGAVNALALSSDGARLYAGGAFTTVGGVTHPRLVALDAATGAPQHEWDPNANNVVRALALSPDGARLYAGGTFTAVRGVARGYLAAVDSTRGSVEAWRPDANGAVNALSLSSDGGDLYAGGDFTGVGGVTRNRLAKIDAAGAVRPWNPDANKAVSALASSPGGDTVYVGGDFTTVSGSARAHLAAVDVGTGAVNPQWNPAADSAVRTISASGRGVYVGGNFGTINSQSRARLALLNDSTGAPVPGWNASANALVRTLKLSADGSRLYAGGAFTEVSGQVRKNLVALDAETGSFVGSWLPTVRRPVFDLAVSGTRVYTAEGGPAGGIVGAYGTDAGTQAWNVKGDGDVQAIALLDEKVYVGGHFVLLGDQARHQIAALDASTGAIDPLWAPTIDGDPKGGRGVWALEASGTQLHVGGDFSRVSQEPQQGVARFSG
jgi:trimeric autotransporter adhesin